MKNIQIIFKEEYNLAPETIPWAETKKYFRRLHSRYVLLIISLFLCIGGLAGGIYFGMLYGDSLGVAYGVACGICLFLGAFGSISCGVEFDNSDSYWVLYSYLLQNENYKKYLNAIKEIYSEGVYKCKQELTNGLEQQIISTSQNRVNLDLNKKIEELYDKLSREESKLAKVQCSLENLETFIKADNKQKKHCLWKISHGYCWTYVSFSIQKS